MEKYIAGLFLIFITMGCNPPSDKSSAQTDELTTDLTVPKEENQAKLTGIKDTVKSPVDNSEFGQDYLMGKIDPPNHESFSELSLDHASSKNMYLRTDAYNSFKTMFNSAAADGINLRIISAARPFNHQKRIWEAKWRGERLVSGKDLSKTVANPVERALVILRYSSMPGTSRHHWGTDIDLNNLENSYFESGQGKKIYDWLVANAGNYGYCQPYSPKGEERPYGYEEEKWHWSYLPVSVPLLNEYKSTINDDFISGFDGSEVAKEIGVVEKYVLGINSACKH